MQRIYSDLFHKIVTKSILVRLKQVKENTQKWFDGEALVKLNPRDKPFQKFKTSKLYIDKDLVKKQNMKT